MTKPYCIDSHAHLCKEYYPNDYREVIQRAVEHGVEKIILPCVSAESIPDIFEVAQEFPTHIFPLIGLHPTDVNQDFKRQLAVLEKHLNNKQIVGIGETGIDLYHDKSFYTEQLTAFETQLNWAKELQKPLSIHIRDGFNEALSVLKKFKNVPLRGILHCFSGGIQEAKWAIDNGYLLGISGVITFKKNKLQDIIKEVGINAIALETDAPFLAPEPYRGKRNESAYIPIIAEKIAAVLETSTEEVMRTTTANVEAIF
ncbi:MAG: TatD family hydrolase [Bacteroidetes bacterium]|nr:TatD family hydrolase [Bacteroidota bacterium]MCL2302028.1 TatD family hydrolase [Lentimicrobiaceae bacterium]